MSLQVVHAFSCRLTVCLVSSVTLAALDFFSYNFPNRTSEGQVLITPSQVRRFESRASRLKPCSKMHRFPDYSFSQALETYWCPFPFDESPGGECVIGDAPTIATVTRLLERLLQLPDTTPPLVTPQQRAAWSSLLALMPPLPINPTTGTLAPGVSYAATTHNSESVGLYAVHPARSFSVGMNLTRPGGVNLSLAAASYYADPFASGNNNGWHQASAPAVISLASSATPTRAASHPPHPGGHACSAPRTPQHCGGDVSRCASV